MLEASYDTGFTWFDLRANIAVGGYRGTVNPSFGNRLAGRMAWCGNPNGTSFARYFASGMLPTPPRGDAVAFGLGSRVRLISHRSFGFHSPAALIALAYLCCGGFEIELPLR